MNLQTLSHYTGRKGPHPLAREHQSPLIREHVNVSPDGVASQDDVCPPENLPPVLSTSGPIARIKAQHDQDGGGESLLWEE